MASKKNLVNDEVPNYGTIGGRLVAERKARGISQIDLRMRMGVSKTTQARYESGDNFPDARYLADLDRLRFDVLYIITGVRSGDALTPEHQNLIEAYDDAPEPLKIAAFGMLLTAYIPFRRHIDDAMKIPGFNRYELAGENDVRYEAHHEASRLLVQENSPESPPPKKPLKI